MSKKHRKLLSVTAEILENVYVRMYSCFLVKKSGSQLLFCKKKFALYWLSSKLISSSECDSAFLLLSSLF